MTRHKHLLKNGWGSDAKLSQADIDNVINLDLSMTSQVLDTCVEVDWLFIYTANWTVADPRVTRPSMPHRSASAQNVRVFHTVCH